jgi:hypothetical protein
MTMTITKGDRVTIHSADGTLIGVGTCHRPTSRQVGITGNGVTALCYSLTTGKEVGGTRYFVPATAEQLAHAEAELEERAEERERQRQAKHQAAYNALPESVKLARSLAWICDINGEAKISKAPIDALRAIVEWAKAEGLDQ